MAVSEEKLTAGADNDITFAEKSTETMKEVLKDEIKSDAMLDEIAAKVDALDFNRTKEEDGDFHAKCMETVKKQGETINTLVQQLRIMFDEYQAVEQEREYYEELNDALIRCLEITEGKVQFESEESEKENEERDENVKSEGVESKETNEGNRMEENLKKEEYESDETVKEEDNEEDTKDEANTEDDMSKSTTSEVKYLAKSELIRLNRILLREIFELRHQIDVMREYLYTDTEGSEYDTATDDDHICEHCTPQNPQEASENKDTKADESYEILENDDTKIQDEPDTE